MSDEIAQEEAEDALEEAAGESSRAAGVLVAVVMAGVAVLMLKVVVTAAPYAAWFAAGILAALAYQKARQRWFTRTTSTEAERDEPGKQRLVTDDDVVTALHHLAAPNVFLSALAAELDLSKEEARTVLEELGVPVRRAVRIGNTTGVGVHKGDLPPLPQDPEHGPVDGVDQEQPTNQQTVRIERTDGGFVIYDLSDGHRHHTAKEH